MTIDT